MSRAAGWHDELRGRAPGDWPALLSEHSGLPGPRANLPLVDAVAELASQATIDALLDSGDEYLVMCAAAALGRRGDDPAAALAACERLTARLAALPPGQRRGADVRTLRQALGYCWSVAVAADPAAGLPAFAALDVADPDVAWIVRTNKGKKRLASLLPSPA